MDILLTRRLELVPITLPMVEAVFAGRRDEAERIAGANLPEKWPGRALVEQAFCCPIDHLRREPESHLWGGRLMISRAAPRVVVGSVIVSSHPDDGTVEIGYGVENASQGRGSATEAVRAVVEWALVQPGVKRVTATTFPWHSASLRVIEKAGMRKSATREHDLLGEMLVFEIVPEMLAKSPVTDLSSSP
jgi:[ribosomal protein S5]-alanine N-acetyltransferase